MSASPSNSPTAFQGGVPPFADLRLGSLFITNLSSVHDRLSNLCDRLNHPLLCMQAVVGLESEKGSSRRADEPLNKWDMALRQCRRAVGWSRAIGWSQWSAVGRRGVC